MYNLKYKTNSNSTELEFVDLMELFKPSKVYEELEDFHESKIYDALDYQIIVLKPYKDDFLILYSHLIKFADSIANFNFKGQLFSEVFRKFEKFNLQDCLQNVYKTGENWEGELELYYEANPVYSAHLLCIKQDNLLHVFLNETTINNVKGLSYEDVSFPVLLLNKNKDILKFNKSFKETFNYTVDELKLIGYNNIVKTFISKNPEVKTLNDAFEFCIQNKNRVNEFETEIIMKDGDTKWFYFHMRLINNDTIYLSFLNHENYKKTIKSAVYFFKYYEELLEASDMAFVLKDETGYYWTEQISEILEIPLDSTILESPKNLIYKHICSFDVIKCVKAINTLSSENPKVTFDYRVIINLQSNMVTGKHKIKTLRTTLNYVDQSDEGEVIYYGLTYDVTHEYLESEKKLTLEKNLENIGYNTHIGIMSFNNGEYSYSPEIYNILETSEDENDKNNDIIKPHIIEEDVDTWSNVLGQLNPDNASINFLSTIITAGDNVKIIDNVIDGEFDIQNHLISYTVLIRDVTEETLNKEEALKLQENLDIISDFSQIAIASYENGEYTWTPSIYKMLKINPEDYDKTVNLLAEFGHPEDIKDFKSEFGNFSSENNTYNGVVRVYNADGELKYLKAQVIIDFDSDGDLDSMVAFLHDVTEETVAKNSALELQRNLAIIQKSSKIVIANYRNGEYNWTSEIYNILEIEAEDYPSNIDLINEFCIDEENYFNDNFSCLSKDCSDLHYYSTVKTPKGNVKILEIYIESYFDEYGILVEFVAFINDVTDIMEYQRELEQLNVDSSLLLQEVHDRVRNNLQIILSFLSLESRYYKDKPEYVILKTQNHINTMAVAYEELYKSPKLSRINLKYLINHLINDLFNRNDCENIVQNRFLDSVYADINMAMPLSLLINELVINCIRYAFPNNEEGNFFVELKSEEDNVILRIWDDGVGLSEDFNTLKDKSLGFQLILKLANQLESEFHVLDDVPGFGVELTFKA